MTVMQHSGDLFRTRKLRRLSSAALPIAALFYSGTAQATDFYVDPAAGSPTGAGTAQSPWQTLERVVQDGRFGTTIRAGDTVFLRTGYHGEFVISSGTYATPITIAAAPGATPRLRRATFNNTQGWVLRGLSISPSHAPTYQRTNIVQISGSGLERGRRKLSALQRRQRFGLDRGTVGQRRQQRCRSRRWTRRGAQQRRAERALRDQRPAYDALIESNQVDQLLGRRPARSRQQRHVPVQRRQEFVRRRQPGRESRRRFSELVGRAPGAWARARSPASCCAATCSSISRIRTSR